MKKYLQPCEIGGSLYGKKKNKGPKPSKTDKNRKKGDIINSYQDFYKNQFETMNRLFHNGK